MFSRASPYKTRTCCTFNFFGTVTNLLATPPLDSDPENWDIADVFSAFSQKKGYEGEWDSYSGLWETCRIYNDMSLLSGDFLAKGLELEISVSNSKPFPYNEFLYSLTNVFDSLCNCNIDKASIFIPTCIPELWKSYLSPLSSHSLTFSDSNLAISININTRVTIPDFYLTNHINGTYTYTNTTSHMYTHQDKNNLHNKDLFLTNFLDTSYIIFNHLAAQGYKGSVFLLYENNS